jgi:hypothetical protein
MVVCTRDVGSRVFEVAHTCHVDLEGRGVDRGVSCRIVGRGSNDTEKGRAELFHAQRGNIAYSEMSVGEVFKVVRTSGVGRRTWVGEEDHPYY